MRISTTVPLEQFNKNLAGLYKRRDQAMTTAVRMAASMIKEKADADITASGNFGGRWIEGLKVTTGRLDAKRWYIDTHHDIPYAGVFEEGAEIHGSPFLWIGFSHTNAEGVPAKEFGDKLFSVKSKSGTPLLFAVADKKPKYFGISSVTIPQKWHIRDIQMSVMQNFRQYFDAAFKGVGG